MRDRSDLSAERTSLATADELPAAIIHAEQHRCQNFCRYIAGTKASHFDVGATDSQGKRNPRRGSGPAQSAGGERHPDATVYLDTNSASLLGPELQTMLKADSRLTVTY